MNPAERQTDAEQALAALIDADSLLFALAMSPARSGQVSVSALRPIVTALHESLPSLKRVVEAHDEEKAAVADEAYAKGHRDATASPAAFAPDGRES